MCCFIQYIVLYASFCAPYIADNLLYFARGYLIHNLDAYTFHIAVFAIEAEGKETYFPETR